MNINKELICEFIAIFSRFEYALKAENIGNIQNGSAKPYWDRFYTNNEDKISSFNDKNEDYKEAYNYLMENSPKKQIYENGRLKFKDVNSNNVLQSIRRVRNNLFHGGKYYPNPDNRDEKLLQYSITILKYCKTIDNGINIIFNQEG